jgi:PhnB protein
MLFYRDCLGGELSIQTIGESLLSDDMPLTMRNTILQATLKKDNFMIVATDMVGDEGLVKGNAVSLMLHCTSEKEARDRYVKLSRGGRQVQPLEINFWGALFGNLTDRFGNHWVLNYQSFRTS